MLNQISFEEFKKIIAEELGVDVNKLDKDKSFIMDLGVDSLSLVNLIIKLEKDYNIKFDNENGFALRNVGEAYDTFISSLKSSYNDKEIM